MEAKRLCPPGKGVAREDSGPTIQKESAISQLSRQNELLKREIDLLNIHRDHKIVSLEETILRLQDRNKELRRMLFRRRDIDELVTEKYNSSSDVILGLTQKLDQKDQEIESKIDQIASLDDQLGAQEWLIRTVEDLECDFTCSSNFSKGLAELNQGARRIAGLLAQCLSRSAIQRVWKKPSKENGFHTFIKSTLRTVRPLDSNPVEGMRALIFAFVRDRIFLSNCWGALHFEGYMLRQLQQFIQKTGS